MGNDVPYRGYVKAFDDEPPSLAEEVKRLYKAAVPDTKVDEKAVESRLPLAYKKLVDRIKEAASKGKKEVYVLVGLSVGDLSVASRLAMSVALCDLLVKDGFQVENKNKEYSSVRWA